ncbi:4Fe-4S dicluster domain-containing protein [Vibrio sp. Vb2880]|uniref:Effector protein n=1 Tax=Vibrio furnissii TaxID=29494 RepID=A0A0Q2UVL6_VIBFU|nr:MULTISPECIES: 4Fe-4S dicluster domain-containing protein [Vibrio]ADT87203.1 electron transport protein (FeS senter) from formate to hydrogen [Vibrio furnissii NCTC 11218]EEX41795.1 electron transport protein hydN [Vibrio furnissii CIP 102972]KQH84584.1 effector protein [Vibrio furnissii]MBO0215267.1 4Fe-4S dicluster domain-containing protein [Vibrio sp. Vb2880]MCG6214229.1 4Fe-4S dicluster domain-containing protein [Vibrio furnissii]
MNRFVFADANKCIGCRTCEVACAISHQDEGIGTLQDRESFLPRLEVIKNAHVTTPVMCRQCDDAPCAQVCPNNAIVHEDGYIKVIQSRCIGCKTCAIACPYGAMNVVTTMIEDTSRSALFARKVPKSQAIKCDLCSHRTNGPACMEVCPTGAISLIEPEEIHQTSQSKREAAASRIAIVTV